MKVRIIGVDREGSPIVHIEKLTRTEWEKAMTDRREQEPVAEQISFHLSSEKIYNEVSSLDFWSVGLDESFTTIKEVKATLPPPPAAKLVDFLCLLCGRDGREALQAQQADMEAENIRLLTLGRPIAARVFTTAGYFRLIRTTFGSSVEWLIGFLPSIFKS